VLGHSVTATWRPSQDRLALQETYEAGHPQQVQRDFPEARENCRLFTSFIQQRAEPLGWVRDKDE
jgi:hypothetical protein